MDLKGLLLLQSLEGWPVALAVWVEAAWLWRVYGKPRSKYRDSEIGPR